MEENEPVMETRRLLEKRENKNSSAGQSGVNTRLLWEEPTLLGTMNVPSGLKGKREAITLVAWRLQAFRAILVSYWGQKIWPTG